MFYKYLFIFSCYCSSSNSLATSILSYLSSLSYLSLRIFLALIYVAVLPSDAPVEPNCLRNCRLLLIEIPLSLWSIVLNYGFVFLASSINYFSYTICFAFNSLFNILSCFIFSLFCTSIACFTNSLKSFSCCSLIFFNSSTVSFCNFSFSSGDFCFFGAKEMRPWFVVEESNILCYLSLYLTFIHYLLSWLDLDFSLIDRTSSVELYLSLFFEDVSATCISGK